MKFIDTDEESDEDFFNKTEQDTVEQVVYETPVYQTNIKKTFLF